MADNQIQMPSSGGGLIRYFDDYKGKFSFSPWVIVIAMGVIALLGILLYKGIL